LAPASPLCGIGTRSDQCRLNLRLLATLSVTGKIAGEMAYSFLAREYFDEDGCIDLPNCATGGRGRGRT
jgi:hypothetical protein